MELAAGVSAFQEGMSLVNPKSGVVAGDVQLPVDAPLLKTRVVPLTSMASKTPAGHCALANRLRSMRVVPARPAALALDMTDRAMELTTASVAAIGQRRDMGLHRTA
ncbi:MAG: hypothetical protein NVSMB2_23360 [Chloroflexota bacterium]